MITAHATGNMTTGTIYGPSMSCYVYAIVAADDVTSGVPLPRYSLQPHPFSLRCEGTLLFGGHSKAKGGGSGRGG